MHKEQLREPYNGITHHFDKEQNWPHQPYSLTEPETQVLERKIQLLEPHFCSVYTAVWNGTYFPVRLTTAHHDAVCDGQAMALSLAVYQNEVRFHLQLKCPQKKLG
jgi:hypothetical protein